MFSKSFLYKARCPAAKHATVPTTLSKYFSLVAIDTWWSVKIQRLAKNALDACCKWCFTSTWCKLELCAVSIQPNHFWAELCSKIAIPSPEGHCKCCGGCASFVRTTVLSFFFCDPVPCSHIFEPVVPRKPTKPSGGPRVLFSTLWSHKSQQYFGEMVPNSWRPRKSIGATLHHDASWMRQTMPSISATARVKWNKQCRPNSATAK